MIGKHGGLVGCLEEMYSVVDCKVYVLGGGAPLLGCLFGIWLLKDQALLLFEKTENMFQVLFACYCVTWSEGGGHCAVIIRCWVRLMVEMNGGMQEVFVLAGYM